MRNPPWFLLGSPLDARSDLLSLWAQIFIPAAVVPLEGLARVRAREPENFLWQGLGGCAARAEHPRRRGLRRRRRLERLRLDASSRVARATRPDRGSSPRRAETPRIASEGGHVILPHGAFERRSDGCRPDKRPGVAECFHHHRLRCACCTMRPCPHPPSPEPTLSAAASAPTDCLPFFSFARSRWRVHACTLC